MPTAKIIAISIACFINSMVGCHARAGLFRSQSKQLRDTDSYIHLTAFKPLLLNPEQGKDNINALVEALYHIDGMSISTSPSDIPSSNPTAVGVPSSVTEAPSKEPTISDPPSVVPTAVVASVPTSGSPSSRPPTLDPTSQPSSSPTGPPSSLYPTAVPTSIPTAQLTTGSPTALPTGRPSRIPTGSPTSQSPSALPTSQPSSSPTQSPTNRPPTSLPTSRPSSSPIENPTLFPSFQACGLSANDRIAALLAVLDSVANSTAIRDNNTPEGKATTWLLAQDTHHVCPGDKCWLQRWVLAVMYYSMNGDGWFQCSANASAPDNCGSRTPFIGKHRFLSDYSECDWAGIACNEGCVSEVFFDTNNLAGTIPTEIGLLSDLYVLGLQRGNTSSTIPTEIGSLTHLIFFDVNFNQLNGSLPSGLLALSTLTQLDLNNNQLTGSIDGIGGFPNMTFMQLNSNFFTGTVPAAVGSYSNLGVFTIQNTEVSGTMPQSVCDLLVTAGMNGSLTNLVADCGGPTPQIVCDCCTKCHV